MVIFILVPPRLTKAPGSRSHVARKGEDVILKCQAKGHPHPTVTWEGKGESLSVSSYMESQGFLLLESVDHSMAGIYICTADNGVGKPATRAITLDILYRPSVTVEQKWVYSGVGKDVEANLACVVKSDPEAEVLWMRGSMFLSEDERHSMTRFGSRYVLTISSVQEEDYGNYTCKAENGLGSDSTFTVLSGTATQPAILSSSMSGHKDRYTLSWRVTSYFPIVDHRVDIKLKNSSSKWFTYSIEQPSHHSRNSVFYQSFPLDNLKPSTSYQAKVWTRNSKGWSKPSSSFQFSTALVDSQPMESASKIESSSSGSAAIFTKITLLLLRETFALLRYRDL